MNKNVLIGAGVVVLIIIIGTWFFTSQSGSSGTDTNGSATSTQTGTSGTSGTGSTGGTAAKTTFREIFGQTGNHQCTYEGVNGSSQISNNVYLSNGKMGGEFRTTTVGKSQNTILVYNGGYLYVWKEGAATGTKTTLRSVADLPDALPDDLTSGAIFGTASNNVSWDCHDWLPVAAKLTPPTYVTFSARQ